MPTRPEITQSDPRIRSNQILDALQQGQSFTITRGGHQIGELIPLRRRNRFVSRAEFAAMSGGAADVSIRGFRADQDAVAPGSK